MQKKVLILKIGYTETLLNEDTSRKISLGDVFRTTPLLHLYKDDYVTWVTDKSAMPLLEGNPYIDRLFPLNLLTVLQLQSEEFDIVINLEKVPAICALAQSIEAYDKFGFRLDKRTGKAEAYDRASDVLTASSNVNIKKQNLRHLQELLFEMVGAKWNGEEYILGYEPKTIEKYDVGFNTQVSKIWLTKAWPIEKWDELERLIGNQFSVSRQEKQPNILESLYNYIDWINSCKLIITNDSLGLHLALALKKKVLAIFGPSNSQEIYFYGRGKPVFPVKNFPCLPCCEYECKNNEFCLDYLTAEKVYDEIKQIMS